MRDCLFTMSSIFGFASLLLGLVHGQDKPKDARAEYLNAALRNEGDVGRGRDVFVSLRLACARCHSIEGAKGKAGPDLFAVGDKFGRREIIESILNPSARIADGYETNIVLTKSDRIFSGVVKQANDEILELLSASGELIRISADEIESRHTSPISVMPLDVHTSLSLNEFSDLVEYLVSLKQTESMQRTEHGMPKQIAELSRPVEFQQFIASEFKFDKPVWMGSLPGCDSGYHVIEHQTRKIWFLPKSMIASANATTAKDERQLFLDLGPAAPNEGRLSAITPHPNFRANHKYYLFDRPTVDGKIVATVTEREASADGRSDSGKPPRTIVNVPQTTGNHFGGWLEFGPDGYLYVSFGDSGPQEDPNGNAQNPRLLLGKILRIDVDHHEFGKGYSVPPDNPFVGDPEMLPEVWALGFRAPWRFCFDPLTSELWVGDVGQDRYEEVTIVRRGENHGWNIYEGFAPFSNRFRRENQNYTLPVFAYGRKYGPSVTGGFVYRADKNSSFYGKYICGDYESRRIFALTHHDRQLSEIRQIGVAPQRVVSFAQDEAGEIYVIGYEGLIYHMDFSNAAFE